MCSVSICEYDCVTDCYLLLTDQAHREETGGRNTLSAFGELEVDCLLFRWKCVWYLFEVHNPITWAQIHFLCKRQFQTDCVIETEKYQTVSRHCSGCRFTQLKHLSKYMILELSLLTFSYPFFWWQNSHNTRNLWVWKLSCKFLTFKRMKVPLKADALI